MKVLLFSCFVSRITETPKSMIWRAPSSLIITLAAETFFFVSAAIIYLIYTDFESSFSIEKKKRVDCLTFDVAVDNVLVVDVPQTSSEFPRDCFDVFSLQPMAWIGITLIGIRRS